VTSGIFLSSYFTIHGLCNVEESLNNELENIHQWLLSNKLTLNVEKPQNT
jgi:hypothetical protein